MTDHSDPETQSTAFRDAMSILDAWQVPFDEQAGYLGLPQDLRRRDYNKYRLGMRRPDTGEVYERSRLINRIHDATLTLFPFSEDAANLWVQVPLRPFGGKSALDMMRLYGLRGMRQVDLALDNQYDPLLGG